MIKNPFIKMYFKKYLRQEIVSAFLYIVFICLSLAGPFLMKYFIDDVLPQKDFRDIIFFVILFFGISLTMSGVAIGIKYSIANLENKILFDVRNRMYSNLVCQNMAYYKDNNVGIAMQRILRDTEVVHQLWGFLFPSVFSSTLTFILTFIIIGSKSLIIALLSLTTIILYIIVFRLYNDRLRNLYIKTLRDIDGMNSCVTDAWNGAKDIKIFRIEKSIIRKFEKITHILKKDKIDLSIKDETSKQLMGLISTLGMLITLAIGGYCVMKGTMTIGLLVALQSYVSKLYAPAKDIADMAVDYKKFVVNVDRISELFFAEKERIETNKTSIHSLQGKIKFEDVFFAYESNHVLNGLSFETDQTGMVSIVGKSGAGKSTIVNILLGFITPQSGKVTFSGRRLQAIELDELRGSISLVSQDAYLFNMSIYDNIKMGNPNASDTEINEIIELLGIDDIVKNYPQKLDTVISEFGKNLSGGQIQRITIARALLKKSKYMIFDESTSNIDSQTEKCIQDALMKLKKDSLIISISHRLASLKNSDMIYVIKDGKIVEEGSLNKLENGNTYFNELFKEQMF